MTARDTAALLQAALQSRAEYAMHTTSTDEELERLRRQMPPAKRSRRVRAMVAAAAGVVVVGGGVGLGLALTGNDDGASPPIISRPSPTTLPAGTLPSGFPIGTFRHPGSGGLTTLKITQGARALVSDPRGTLRSTLTFTTPDIVTFTPTSGVGCATPGRYQWSVASNQLTLTTVSDACIERRIALTEKSWGPITKTQSP